MGNSGAEREPADSNDDVRDKLEEIKNMLESLRTPQTPVKGGFFSELWRGRG
jgi:hypothetical protein